MQTAVYEQPHAYTNFYGFEYRNGKKEEWSYKFKNYYDKEKRLVKREDSLWRPLKIIEYHYDKKGLLTKRIEYLDRKQGKMMRTQFIRFEYW
jgi:hypothetical protein